VTKALVALALLGALTLLPSFGAANTPPPRPAATPAMPCGAVSFIPNGPPRYAAGTMTETIKVTVSFRDGHEETAVFPYPWVYPNFEETDPWSPTNIKRGDFPVPIQRPPPGTDMSKLPLLIAYVLDAAGLTDLKDCPRTWSGAAPGAPAKASPTATPGPR
jgi:hypothetical protein